MTSTSEAFTPIPAATLILYRDRADAPAEHLFVERAVTMAFAAGATVFPGGRVDEDDHFIAENYLEYGRDEAAARIAAIRETLEEAGVAVGLSLNLSPAHISAMRAALAGGAFFSTLLAVAGLSLDLGVLTAFARWCPNHKIKRIFDTRFYIARAPEDAHEASVDETENVHLFWASAAEVLAKSKAGETRIIFPTMCNLERLATVPYFAEAVIHAETYPIEVIVPSIIARDGESYLSIPEDIGYPVTEQNLEDAKRG